MFSSTTIASSITMPTISTRASMVTLLSVKSSAHIIPNVAMTEAGMATRGDHRRAPAPHERQHHQGGQDAAQHQVEVDLVERGVDVARLVADDLQPDVGRQELGLSRARFALTASITATVFAPDCRRISRVTVGTPFRRTTERCSLVPSSAWPMSRTRTGAPLMVATTRSLNASGLDAAHRAERLLLAAGGDVAAGQVGVLPHDGVADGGDGHLVGRQPVGVDPDVDRPLQAADHLHLADAGRALELDLDHLVGDLGQLAEVRLPDRASVITGDWSLSNLAITGGRSRAAGCGPRWRRGRGRPGRRRRCRGSG